MSLKSISLSKINTINDAIKILNNSQSQIALIKNKKNQLIGTVTDGDIRRSLLKNKNFNSKLSEIMNKKPFVVKNKISSIEIILKKEMVKIKHYYLKIKKFV